MLNSGVSHLQKPMQTYQALYRRTHTFAQLYRWKNQNEVQDSEHDQTLCASWAGQSHTLAPHRGSTHCHDGDWAERNAESLAVGLLHQEHKTKQIQSSPQPRLRN